MPARVRNWAIVVVLLVVVSVGVILTRPVVLGLDLQGGIHLVLEVNDEDILEHELRTTETQISNRLEEQEKATPTHSSQEGRTLILHFADSDKAEDARVTVENYALGFSKVQRDDSEIRVALSSLYVNNRKQVVLQQTMETLARRLNETGIAEPSIHRQGYDKIVVQLAGVTTSLDLKSVIEKTAVLKFRLVEASAADQEILLQSYNGKVPDDMEVFPQRDIDGNVTAWFLVKKRPEVDGTLLEDAITINDDRGLPAVSFAFNAEGAEQFGKLTGENIGTRLAIVLDNTVKSAPVVQSQIRRQGQITGNFTLSEAQSLAIVLRSGPLPVKLRIAEERLVGPSLGHDSIEQGRLSMIVGSVLVLIFMVVYYRKGGIFANVALALNILFIVAFLCGFGAVLTLPGIAGLVLTVGMAVDSNVLIFERMREELISGKSVRASIDAGYGKATTTILDANVTTLITGIVLFLFGTGPVKGFAVILTIGILSSVFTSVIVTRLFYDYMTAKSRMQTLSI